MNRSNRSKETAKRLLDISKFDVSRYDKCADLDAIGWAGILLFRAVVHNVLLGPENDRKRAAQGRGDHEDGLGLLLQIMEDPMPKRPDQPLWSPMKYHSVCDVVIYDLWNGRKLFTNLPEAAQACKQLDEDIEASINPDMRPQLPFESFHSHLLAKRAWVYRHTEPLVSVDLRATDEQIKAQFAQWLRAKRQELRSHDFAPEVPTRFTEADFRKWHEYRVLAFIDLEMLSYHTGIALTDELVAERLALATADQVRKTVRPLAKKLMCSSIIEALDWQAGYEWNSRNAEASSG